jgi:hypothetical protein
MASYLTKMIFTFALAAAALPYTTAAPKFIFTVIVDDLGGEPRRYFARTSNW